MCPIQKFQHAISSAGLYPPMFVDANGARQTFQTKIQGQKIEAWYLLSSDLKTGCFGIAGLPVRWDVAGSTAQLASKPWPGVS